MHQSTKPSRFNKVKNKNVSISTSDNKCIEILPTQVILHSGQQQIYKKWVNNKSEIRSGSCKRILNLQANNFHNINAHTGLKISSPLENLVTHSEQDFSSAYINNKYDPTLSTKKYINSKMYLQNYNSVVKPELQNKNLYFKKCGKVSKLHHNDIKATKQDLNNEMPNKLVVEPLLQHDADRKTGEGSSLENMPSNVEKPHKKRIKQDKANKEKEEFGECLDEYIYGCAKETREKTPMCLVNDLARFNKIPFQYRLTSEEGPAHCKIFTVTLKLGDEEYTAEGFKIKKAQHLAAKEAIEKTQYKHPTPKANRRSDNEVSKLNITPTVELNALAMKLGQQTSYMLSENGCNREIPQTTNKYNVNRNWQSLNKYQNSYAKLQQSIRTNKFNQLSHPEPSYISNFSLCKITLLVGNQKFFGIGKTPQQAKHDAATNALQVLKHQMSHNQSETNTEILDENEQKSPISLVFEIGVKRKLAVDFKVLREEGPAHMRMFTTACIVGDIITEGEAPGKKLSRKKAAQKMLEELKKLPPLSPDISPLKRTKTKTSKNTEVLPSCEKNKNITETDLSNHVTKVIECNQNNNEQEPLFKVASEFGKENFRRRRIVMKTSSNKVTPSGMGNSKKPAKRDAAENPNMVEQKNRNSSKKTLEFSAENQSPNSLKSKDTTFKSAGLHMKDQLLYLANLLGFEVDFSDYPKGNHNEFLTIVMLSTNPPQICHGVGINSKESQEDASKNALKILSEMGLNNAEKL